MTIGVYDRLSPRHKWQPICNNTGGDRHLNWVFVGALRSFTKWDKAREYPEYQIAIIEIDNPTCEALQKNIATKESYVVATDLIAWL